LSITNTLTHTLLFIAQHESSKINVQVNIANNCLLDMLKCFMPKCMPIKLAMAFKLCGQGRDLLLLHADQRLIMIYVVLSWYIRTSLVLPSGGAHARLDGDTRCGV
jgi:hypothetical protein